MPRITFKKSEHEPVDLHEAAIVGRSEQHANVVVKDNRLSRAHCRFEPREDASWAVVDMESQNGTFLNGRRIKESLVKPGDIITIGACDMVFEGTGAGASTVMAGVQSTKVSGSDFSAVGEDKPQPASASNKIDSTRTVVAPAALVVISGDLKDKIHPITQDAFTIGRKKDNHLCLEGDTKASSHHAVIRRDGLAYVLEDLKSMNGVTVNGRKITEPVSLSPGNKVGIGLIVFEFQLQGRPNVSSGLTAPKLAREDIKARLSSPQSAGETGDLGELDIDKATKAAAQAPAQDAQSEGEASAEISEHDRAALTQKVAKVSGGAVFGFIEVAVVLLIAGGVLFAAWTMMKDDGSQGATTDEGYPPARSGGLLTINPSFDERDDATGFPKGWRYEIAGTDSFSLVEGAKGGPYAMSMARFTPGNSISYAVAAPAELAGARGIKASAFAMNSEFAVDRFGTAVLSIFWFEHPRDRDPILVTPVAFKTRIEKWTELAGSAAAPTGAKAYSVAVGICGASGSVAFDDVMVERDDGADRWWQPYTIKMKNGLTWEIAEDGSISLLSAQGVLLRGGRITMHQVDGRADPVDALSMLADKPNVVVSDSRISAGWNYFDPMAEKRVRLNLELAADDRAARLTAGVTAMADGGIDNASRRVSLHVLATPQWAPAELLRFEGDSLMEYRSEIGGPIGARKTIGSLLSANTGTGNRISAGSGTSATLIAQQHPLGRELFLQNSVALVLNFAEGERQDELQQEIALLATVQKGEDQVDRVNRALRVFAEFPYCQPELATAAQAIDSVAKDFKLKLVELRDGINVPQLTRNERLYRNAMETAISISQRLSSMRANWESQALDSLRAAGQVAMSQATRDAAEQARLALVQLVNVSNDFSGLEQNARKSLFLLEIDVQQRDSEPFMVSARDFLSSGQVVQGMLKLRTVVTQTPRCLRGIEAKERMVDVAEILIAEAKDYASQGLKNIATDRGVLSRGLLNLVEKQLLQRLLSDTEKGWLLQANFGDGGKGRDWLERERLLAVRIGDLRLKLPQGLPPVEEE